MEQLGESPILLEFLYKFVSQQVEVNVERELLTAAAGSKQSAENLIISYFAERRQAGTPGIADFLHVARNSSNASNVLHCAAETGSLTVLKGVFQLLPGWIGKELMNGVDRNGRNVVHLVLQSGKGECLGWLFKILEIDDEVGSFLIARDNHRNNIFHFAVNNDVGVLLSLLENNNLPDGEILDLMSEKMSEKNQFGLTPVMLVAAQSDSYFTEALLDFLHSRAGTGRTGRTDGFAKFLLETDSRRNSALHHAMLNKNKGTLQIWLRYLQKLNPVDVESLLRSTVMRTMDNIIHAATERVQDPDLLILFFNFVKKAMGKKEFVKLMLEWNPFQQTIVHKAINNAAIMESSLKYLESEVEAKKLIEFLTDKRLSLILHAVRQAEIPALTTFLGFYAKLVPLETLASELTRDLRYGNTLLEATKRSSEVAVFYYQFLQERCGAEVLKTLVNEPDGDGHNVAQLAEALDYEKLLELIIDVRNA